MAAAQGGIRTGLRMRVLRRLHSGIVRSVRSMRSMRRGCGPFASRGAGSRLCSSSAQSADRILPLRSTWDKEKILSYYSRPSGFGSYEEMLEYGRKRKEMRERAEREGLPSPFRITDTFSIPKHEIMAAIQEADAEALGMPDPDRGVAIMTGHEMDGRVEAFDDGRPNPSGDMRLSTALNSRRKVAGYSLREYELMVSEYEKEGAEEEDDTDAKGRPRKRRGRDPKEMSRMMKLANQLKSLLPLQVDIERRMYNKVVPGGVKNSFGTLIVAGNGKGYAGWGYGRSINNDVINDKARIDLLKNLMFVPLYQGRTIFQDSLYAKFQGTKMYMWRRDPGHGIQAAPLVRLILEAFGIDDVTVKIHGQRTRSCVVKCLFKLLAQVKDATEHYHSRGKAMYDPDNRLYRPLTYKEMKEQQMRVKEIISTIPQQYGIYQDKGSVHPLPSREEFDHFEKMEQLHDQGEEADQMRELQKIMDGDEEFLREIKTFDEGSDQTMEAMQQDEEFREIMQLVGLLGEDGEELEDVQNPNETQGVGAIGEALDVEDAAPVAEGAAEDADANPDDAAV